MSETFTAITETLGKLYAALDDPRHLMLALFVVLGAVLKQSRWPKNNSWIPWILLLIGAAYGPFVVQPPYKGIAYGAVLAIASSWIYDHMLRPLSYALMGWFEGRVVSLFDCMSREVHTGSQVDGERLTDGEEGSVDPGFILAVGMSVLFITVVLWA